VEFSLYPVDLRVLVGGRLLGGDGGQRRLECGRVVEQADAGRQAVHDATRTCRRRRRRRRTKLRVLRHRPADRKCRVLISFNESQTVPKQSV